MQAANGTQSDGDLTSLNDEYQSMKSEIARIGANTEWNGKKIFDGIGFPGETKFQVGADAGQTIGVVIDKLAISELGKVTGTGFVAHPSVPPLAVTTADSFTSHPSTAPLAQSTPGTQASPGSDFDGDGDADIITWNQNSAARVYLNDGSGGFTASTALNTGQAYDSAALSASDSTPTSAATSALDFSSVTLNPGDKVTIAVPGGSSVSAIMDSSGLGTLLSSLGSDLAAQSNLFSSTSNVGNVLTVSGLTDGSAMPTLSVTLEAGVDTTRFDFSGKNLEEGDQIVINVSGGTDVQGTLDSNGLDHLLGTLATQLQAQGSLFSNAFVNNGVLGLTGLTDGSAITTVTVSLNTASMPIENTNVSNYSNATTTLGNVDQAIEDVSRMRAKYGATFNQLFAAINNLTTVSANTSSSRSEIEDADYAKESSNLASAQIRNQGAKAMLAQANTDQQLTLSLLEDWL